MTQVADPIQRAGSSLMTLPREVTPNEGNSEYDGYFCIKTDEYKCACRERTWHFIHCADKIVVWEEKDDNTLLHFAQMMKEMGLNPRIIEYNVMLGKAVRWDDIPAGATIG